MARDRLKKGNRYVFRSGVAFAVVVLVLRWWCGYSRKSSVFASGVTVPTPLAALVCIWPWKNVEWPWQP
jgi:hypothetical protein